MLADVIYERKEVVSPSGEVLPLHACISPAEGAFLRNLIQGDASIVRTIETGCAYGLASLHICSALRDRPNAWHVIIDPLQSTEWRSTGVANLKREGLTRFELFEEGSEFVLSRLAAEQSGTFDLVFLDGFHTFDHVLLDCFYATRLLRVGGYLVLDDTDMQAIARVLDYIQNYPCYRRRGGIPYVPKPNLVTNVKITKALGRVFPTLAYLLARYGSDSYQEKWSMVALQKQAEDERDWSWFHRF
jgi:predicted O-methyltransferase YrrM